VNIGQAYLVLPAPGPRFDAYAALYNYNYI
jgi:hypothetical protein